MLIMQEYELKMQFKSEGILQNKKKKKFIVYLMSINKKRKFLKTKRKQNIWRQRNAKSIFESYNETKEKRKEKFSRVLQCQSNEACLEIVQEACLEILFWYQKDDGENAICCRKFFFPRVKYWFIFSGEFISVPV